MKKQFLLLFVALSGLASPSIYAGSDRILLQNPAVVKVGDSVMVSFRIEVTRNFINKRHSLLILPCIKNEDTSAYFTAVVIKGKRSAVAEKRYLAYSDRSSVPADMIYMEYGECLEYKAALPYARWMEGAELVVESIDAGSSRYRKLTDDMIIPELNLKPAADVRGVTSMGAVRETGELSVFNRPYIAEYDEQAVQAILDGDIFDEDVEYAPTLYFSGNNTTTGSYQDRQRPFSEAGDILAVIKDSEDVRLRAIIVAGFAAPGEDFTVSDRQAWERAVTVKKHLLKDNPLPVDSIYIYNGSEDWRGLRLMVEQAHHSWTKQVLEIIDNTPVADESGRMVRLEELKKLNGGWPYEYIRDNYFPKLRRASVIRVYISTES